MTASANLIRNREFHVDYLGHAQWLEKKEYDKAIADFNEVIQIAPTFANAYFNRGFAWFSKREYDKAIADFNEDIRLEPTFVYAYGLRGESWYEKKEYSKAITDFDNVIRLDSTNALAYGGRGNAWLSTRQYDKAIADYNVAIRLNSNYAVAYMNRGSAWVEKKEYDKAIDDYTEAVRLDPKYALAYSKLAWLLATCPDKSVRDGKRAVLVATRSCELTQWKNANDLDTLAAAYAEVGDFDKAVEWQEKVIQLATDTERKQKYQDRLKLYKEKKPYRETE